MRELLEQIVQIARDAGAVIDRIYQCDFVVVTKEACQTPLTEADTAAHELIVARLAQVSDLPVLSEESPEVAWAERQSWTRYWLVDPLDGTKEFVSRNGEFTVNIALIDEGKPVLGVVYAPALKRMYYAASGLGAFRQDETGPARQISVCTPQAGAAWQIVGSRSHHSEAMSRFLAHLGEVEMVPMGSSLKFCVVAEGGAHLYPRLVPTSEWDTAAAQCVLEEAGGEVLTDCLQPLRYNTKDSLRNPYFIACGGRSPAWLSYFQPCGT